MAALAIWCGPHLEPNFTASAYRELSDACEMFRENNSKRSQGVRVSCLYDPIGLWLILGIIAGTAESSSQSVSPGFREESSCGKGLGRR